MLSTGASVCVDIGNGYLASDSTAKSLILQEVIFLRSAGADLPA
jgi:hypothetical protein